MGVFKSMRDLQKQAKQIEATMPPVADRMAAAQARMAAANQMMAALFTGVLFLAMAVGGLIPLLFRLADDLRRPSSRPDPVIPGMQPLVRAAVPSVPGLQPGPGTTFQPGATATFQPGAAGTFQPGAAGTFQPGMLPVPGPVPGTGAVSLAAARSTELLRTGVWLIVSLAGTAFGIALSTSLISMLR